MAVTMPTPISAALQVRQVTITDIDDTLKIAQCIDTFGSAYRLSTFALRYKGVGPAIGDTWLIDKQYGTWQFATFIGAQPDITSGGDGEPGAPGIPGGLSAQFTFSSTTSFGDPGDGKLRLSGATLAVLTISAYFDDLDKFGVNIRDAFATIGDGTSDPLGYVKIEKVGDPSIYAIGNITAYAQFSGLTAINFKPTAYSSTMPFNDGDIVVMSMVRNGDAGSSDTFVFDQDVASDLWEIEHSLGYFPNVTVVDTDKREVEADVVYIDDNNITVGFASPQTGQAFLS